MLRAVPATVLTADSSVEQFKSGSLILAISSTCAFVTFPTFSLPVRPLPFSTFAAFFSKAGGGGGFQNKSKGPVGINGNNAGNDHSCLLLGCRVKPLAELHDVDAMLTKCRPHGRSRVCGTSRTLQLDLGNWFFGH